MATRGRHGDFMRPAEKTLRLRVVDGLPEMGLIYNRKDIVASFYGQSSKPAILRGIQADVRELCLEHTLTTNILF
jgi:hypothetical protein